MILPGNGTVKWDVFLKILDNRLQFIWSCWCEYQDSNSLMTQLLIVVAIEITFFCSGISSFNGVMLRCGYRSFWVCRKGSPCHYKRTIELINSERFTPCDKTSAELLEELTWHQFEIAMSRCISPIRFATKVDHFRNGDPIQVRVMMESDQRDTSECSEGIDFLTFEMS